MESTSSDYFIIQPRSRVCVLFICTVRVKLKEEWISALIDEEFWQRFPQSQQND